LLLPEDLFAHSLSALGFFLGGLLGQRFRSVAMLLFKPGVPGREVLCLHFTRCQFNGLVLLALLLPRSSLFTGNLLLSFL
jgi:hypothetical protein